MNTRSVSRLADVPLVQGLKRIVGTECATTAEMLVYIAEVDARRLHLGAGYDSMYTFCVGELHMSEDVALRRLHAARAGHAFPALLDAVAENRLHLSAVTLLAPRLTADNVQELVQAATHRSNAEIRQLLADRFARPDVPTRMTPVPQRPQLGPDRVVQASTPGAGLGPDRVATFELTGQSGAELGPDQVACPPPARIRPLAPQRFALQVTIPQKTHDKIRHAQDLLGHEVPPGDIAQVLDMAMDELNAKLEKRKFAASTKPRKSTRQTNGASRHIPAAIERTVWKRDRGQCTFVSDTGKRCCSRRDLEFDHIEPFARGGKATASNIRLRCRGHNQYEAERVYGESFMKSKRDEAKSRSHTAVEANPIAKARDELVPWLKALGFRTDEAQRAAAQADSIAGAPLEERVKRALSGFRMRGTTHTPAPHCMAT